MNLDLPPHKINITCDTCGLAFEALRIGTIGPVRCESCTENQIAKNQEAVLATISANRKRLWADICPREFQTLQEGGETDLNRLRLEQAKFDEVMSWQYGRRGLLLIGDTGKCKTRCAWRLVRRLHDEGRRVKAITANRFDLEAQELAGRFKSYFDALVKADVVFFDDVGKGRFTDMVESRFFGLIDERTAHGRPCIVTSNDTGATLEARMSEQRGSAIVRRLREYSDVIVFR